jgi:putative acetyltransferase
MRGTATGLQARLRTAPVYFQMSPDIVIRRERPDQPDVIAALGALDQYLASLYPPEANHILGVEALLAPDIRFLVARASSGQLAGTGAYRLMPGEADTADRPYGEVKRMYVDPARRGERIGARILHALESDMRQEGLSWALLETGEDQVEAVRLYQRAGYARRAAFGGYPDNGLSLFFAKALA